MIVKKETLEKKKRVREMPEGYLYRKSMAIDGRISLSCESQ